MRDFYNIFPYPKRPWFAFPQACGSLLAHGGFFNALMCGDQATAQSVWNASRVPKDHSERARLLQQLQNRFPKSSRVVLVGCGTDEPVLFRTLHPRNPMTAIDLSRTSLRRARWRLALADLRSGRIPLRNTQILEGDATHLLTPRCADFIQCFGVLHHQTDPQPLLQSMARALRPQGVIRLMIYSRRGRSLERRIQQRHAALWSQKHGHSDLKRALMRLWLWQLSQQLSPQAAVAKRFAYIGLSRSELADAFLHPSDPGLDLRRVPELLHGAGLRLIFFEARTPEGWIKDFSGSEDSWNLLQIQEQKGLITSNIVLAAALKSS